MELGISFFVSSIMIGAGLAMDAFSVSLANGLNEPRMGKGRMCAIAGIFSAFQTIMPLIGWVCVHTVLQYFSSLENLIPWIALALLAFIGGKMALEGIRGGSEGESEGGQNASMGLGMLMVQGIATSIDALSVGFTISDHTAPMAVICAVIIGMVTFAICLCGLLIGRKFGTKLAGKAQILGGVILIAIGVEIFITGVLK